MTQDTVRTLTDDQLVQVIAWAQVEQKTRAEKRKQETIAKIKELARASGLSVSVEGVRGRPQKGGKVSRRLSGSVIKTAAST